MVQSDARSSGGSFSDYAIDTFFFPEMSSIKACRIPEIKEEDDIYTSFVLSTIFQTPLSTRPKTLFAELIRRSETSVRSFNQGRSNLVEFLNARAQKKTGLKHYLRSLECFEQCVVSTELGGRAVTNLLKLTGKQSPYGFETNDRSFNERLRCIYNAIKHYDGPSTDEGDERILAPVWITDTGLKEGKSGISFEIAFEEMLDRVSELHENAKFFLKHNG
jgi:hypothetical protein